MTNRASSRAVALPCAVSHETLMRTDGLYDRVMLPALPAIGDSLHVGVFANDLFVPESQWTNQSSLLTIDPGAGTIDPLALDCAGALSVSAT